MPIEICMPRLVDSMTHGGLVAWRKGEGEQVRAGEVIAEIEADKTTVDLESPCDGTLERILIPAGTDKVEVGTLLAVLADQSRISSSQEVAVLSNDEHEHSEAVGSIDERVSESVSKRDSGNGSPVLPTPATKERNRASAVSQSPHPFPEVDASPLARSMAQQAGLDLTRLAGSGPSGRVLQVDVLRALGGEPGMKQPRPPAPPSTRTSASADTSPPFEEIPHSRTRQVIAERLGESKRTIPHFYLEVHCRIDALLRVRDEIQGRRDGGLKLSINDFVIRAAALALRAVPEVNARWTESATRRFSQIDLAVAIATEAGLVAPVIRDADRKGLADLSAEIRDLAQRAREGRLRPEDLQGGTFTVSNLGMYGVDAIFAIINPPQAGILGIGAAEPRPVAQDGSVVVGTVMTCTLSADHRLLDGAAGARFLSAFKNFIEQPLTMIL